MTIRRDGGAFSRGPADPGLTEPMNAALVVIDGEQTLVRAIPWPGRD